MEKVRPWCGQPSDRGRLKNRTELAKNTSLVAVVVQKGRVAPSMCFVPIILIRTEHDCIRESPRRVPESFSCCVKPVPSPSRSADEVSGLIVGGRRLG